VDVSRRHRNGGPLRERRDPGRDGSRLRRGRHVRRQASHRDRRDVLARRRHLDARLGLAAATGKDGKIYAIGGRDATQAPTDIVEVYSPATQTWSKGPSLSTKRLALVAVTGADGKIYAIGGRDAANNPLTVVEAFDTDTGVWTTVQPLLTGRYWFGATLGTDGRIYALGGLGDLGFLDDVEAFTPGTGWKALKAMPEPRGWLSAATSADGRVFAIGGSTPSEDMPAGQPPPMRTMLGFDPKTSVWTQ